MALTAEDRATHRSLEFVNDFVSLSRKFKQPYVSTWREVIRNFMVDAGGDSRSVAEPYGQASQRHPAWYQQTKRKIILKDGETHKAIMTYASRLVTTILGDARGEYVMAQPVGYEDALGKGRTVTSLLRYFYAQEGIFRTMVEAVVDMLLMGTSIVFIPWKTRECDMPVREVGIDPWGMEFDSFSYQRVLAVDDPTIVCIDNEDFYPDGTESRLQNMVGVARGIRMVGARAQEMVEGGLFEKGATDRALAWSGPSRQDSEDEFRSDQPDSETQKLPAEFKLCRGFEYWGEVPWKPADGVRRRRITTLNNQLVADKRWPLADCDLPFRELVINPVNGRFYGISPGEVIRYDQDLQDVVKGLLARAIVRQIEPPLIYNTGAGIDLERLRHWKPGVPIGIDGPVNGNIDTLQYKANVFSGFQQVESLKVGMQQTSGAAPNLQGEPGPTQIRSATEAQINSQNAMNRPELGAMLLERESMPAISRSVLRRYQQFLSTEGLRQRVGEQPEPTWIGDIMGDFDVRFMGSRRAITRQQQLQAYDRLAAMTAAIPEARIAIPWTDLMKAIVGDVLELPEVAAKMSDPKVMLQNMLLQQLMGEGGGGLTGNGNGATVAPEPAGLIPAQAAGGAA